jgi:hypothetical protein
MNRQVTRAGLAAALAFFLAALAGPRAGAADKPSAPPPPSAPAGAEGVPAPAAYPSGAVLAPARARKLRLRVPFTPTNEDGSPGKRTLITITVEGDDRDQALEAADQVIERLIVRPALDEVWDEIDQRIEDAIRSGGLPGILPPPHEMPPGAASRQVQGGRDAVPPAPAEGESEPASPVRVRSGVEITTEGLLESFDAAGLALGIPSLISLLTHEDADPNQRMEALLFQSGDIGQINAEWKKFWTNDQPSHMTYERIHGGIGP